ncbi:MAG TPA: peptidase M3 [Planctomycetaceae bacterium]|nr:peptidase M3 [Planctomycetaceae bacterium]HRF02819.1 M3 family metallopeptidase [Pirellulaceae bacterium]
MGDTDVARFLQQLADDYLTRHVAKEDAFWQAYMGLADDPTAARERLAELEIEINRWLQDPERLARVRARLSSAEIAGRAADDPQRIAIEGWTATFEAHAIDSAAGREASERVVRLETELAEARSAMPLGWRDADGSFHPASSVALSGMLRTDPDEARRRAAWEGLRSIERTVLERGFLPVVRERNRLGRQLGGEDYYDWKTQRTERMPKREIFELLDELEVRTRGAGERALAELRSRHGSAVTPWNVLYLVSGDVTSRLDPYFPFALGFERWGRSFAGLGCDYRGARLVLDLLDRPGKYENGFMHGPEPAWRTERGFVPARIHFTANAIPTQIGAGQRGLETLFHEGGHAVHFANIDMPAPCFAQEFAPTSVAYSEIQSMFMDSLIGDADWLRRYARTRAGEVLPFELIEATIRAKQPFAAWMTRAMLVVPYAERAIYELPEERLTADEVLRVCRDVERRLLGIGSHRPVLSVPHLLAGESSAYYHGYVLAEMGVEQTRDLLLQRDGQLTDNPRVGPTLCERYWEPGNRFGLHEYLVRMTGERLSARALAERVNRTADEAVAEAREKYERSGDSSGYQGRVDLNASIALVHGRETIAETNGSDFAAASSAFVRRIDELST